MLFRLSNCKWNKLMKIYITKHSGTIKATKSLQGELLNLPDGQYTLTVEKTRQWRSYPQNNHFHWLCDFLQDNTDIGYTSTEWKDFFKSELLKEKKRNPVNKRKKFTRVKWTSELDTKDFSEFIEKILIFCETELQIPRIHLIPKYYE